MRWLTVFWPLWVAAILAICLLETWPLLREWRQARRDAVYRARPRRVRRLPRKTRAQRKRELRQLIRIVGCYDPYLP